MNYETEPWYKLYIRESTEDKLLPVLNRGLRDFLLRFAKSRQNATILAKTENPGADLARALGAHPSETETFVAFVDSMLEDGYLTHRRGRLWITNFVSAQEARSPGAQRQARWRAANPGLDERRRTLSADRELVARLRGTDGNACAYCLKEMDFRPTRKPTKATVDHVVPITRGGSDDESNLALACLACNMEKTDRTPDEAGMRISNTATMSRVTVTSPSRPRTGPGDVTRDTRETSPKIRSDPRREETRRDETTRARDPSTAPVVADLVPEPEDPGRETMCPTDLDKRAEKLGVLAKLAENLAVPIESIRHEAKDFADFYSFGGGAGERRTGWMRQLRERIRKRHREGQLKPLSAIEHDARTGREASGAGNVAPSPYLAEALQLVAERGRG